MMMESPTRRRILILGSVASGKTTLARQLAKRLSLPIVHVDQIEFNPDLSKKKLNSVRDEISAALMGAGWILDGHGPLDMLPMHLKNADTIVYLDFSYYHNLYWLLKRQFMVLFKPRSELPPGANEWTPGHFKKMYQTLGKQHQLMNPELLRILNRPENQVKLIHIKNRSQWIPALERISS